MSAHWKGTALYCTSCGDSSTQPARVNYIIMTFLNFALLPVTQEHRGVLVHFPFVQACTTRRFLK